MFEKLTALQGIHAEAMKKLQADGEAAIKEALAEFFTAHPSVAAIRWTQYTPYFNDGDACVFSVHEPEFKLVGNAGGEGDDDDGFIGRWDRQVYQKPEYEKLSDDLAALGDVLQSDALEVVLKAVFGDHMEVTATPDKIEAAEYSHD